MSAPVASPPKYFVSWNDHDNVHHAVFRVRKRALQDGGGSVGEMYVDGAWVENPDIVRRYLNGFDADVDQVPEEKANEIIAKIPRRKR